MALQTTRRRVKAEPLSPTPKPKLNRRPTKAKAQVKPPTKPRARQRGRRRARSESSYTPESDLLDTPPPLPHLPIQIVNADEPPFGVGAGGVGDCAEPLALDLDLEKLYLPPPAAPKGPVCWQRTVRLPRPTWLTPAHALHVRGPPPQRVPVAAAAPRARDVHVRAEQ